MKKSLEGSSKNYNSETVAWLEKNRDLSDKELLKRGAEYKINKKGDIFLDLTPEQMEEIRCMEDRDGALELVKTNGYYLKLLSPELQEDEEIVLEAVKKHGGALKYAPNHLRNKRDVVLAAIKQNGSALEYASPELRFDEELIKIANF